MTRNRSYRPTDRDDRRAEEKAALERAAERTP